MLPTRLEEPTESITDVKLEELFCRDHPANNEMVTRDGARQGKDGAKIVSGHRGGSVAR